MEEIGCEKKNIYKVIQNVDKAWIGKLGNRVIEKVVFTKIKSIQPGVVNYGECECMQAKIIAIKLWTMYGTKADALNVLNVINVSLLDSLDGLNVSAPVTTNIPSQ